MIAIELTQACDATGNEPASKIIIGDAPVVFGRSSQTDMPIPTDKMASSRHFQVHREAGSLFLLDLGSTNGTRVNGQRVRSAQLVDGDVIEAGNTCFTVRATGLTQALPTKTDSVYIDPTSSVEFNPFDSIHGMQKKLKKIDDTADGDRSMEPLRELQLAARREVCPSGITRLTGSFSAPTTCSTLAEALQATTELYFSIHFERFGQPLPDECNLESSSLFRSLPPAAAATLPVLLSANEYDGWKESLEAGWGKNAIIILLTSNDKTTLLDRMNCHALNSNNVASGVCWPSVLRAMLYAGVNDIGERLLDVVDALLIEGEKADTWEMFGKPEFFDQLTDLKVFAPTLQIIST
ncbi:MAG: FHA domain-containing protein [Pirellulaceae bacterium]